MDVNKLSEIIDQLRIPDNEIIQAAEQALKEYRQSDPISFIDVCFSLATASENTRYVFMSLTMLKECFYTLHVQNGQLNQLPPNVHEFIQQSLIGLVQNQRLEVICKNIVFSIIRILIPVYVLPGNWPQIIDVLLSLVEVQEPLAVELLSSYILVLTGYNDIQPPEGLFGHLGELLLSIGNCSNAKFQAEIIKLSFNMVILDPSWKEYIINFVPQVLPTLPEDCIDDILNSFLSIFRLHFTNLGDALENFTVSLLIIASNQENGLKGRISAIEALTQISERSEHVHSFIIDHAADFMNVLNQLLSNPFEDDFGEMSVLYTASESLLGMIVESKECKNALYEQFKCIPNLNNYSRAVFLHYLPRVELYEDILNILGSNDNILINQNCIQALEYLIKNNLRQLMMRYSNALVQVIEYILAQINAGQDFVIPSLANLAESLNDINSNIFEQLVPTLIQLTTSGQFNFTTHCAKCTAAVARDRPDLLDSDTALHIGNMILQYLDQTNDDEKFELMISSYYFVKCMSSDSQNIYHQLLIEKITADFTLLLITGTRLIIKEFGGSYAQFLDSFMTNLFAIASQDVDVYMTKDSDNAEESILIPGRDMRMTFNNAQYDEITAVIETIADFVVAFSQYYESYVEQTYQIATSKAIIIISDSIREASYQLLESLAICFPNYDEEIIKFIIEALCGHQEENDPGEMFINVEKKMTDTLNNILKSENCPNEVRIQFLESMPRIVTKFLTEVRGDYQNNDFKADEDLYLDALWNLMYIMKTMYKNVQEPATITFNHLINIIPNPFQETDPITLLHQFSVAIWLDFFEFSLVTDDLVSQFSNCLQALFNWCLDEDVDIRKMAIYGIGHIPPRLPLPQELYNSLILVLQEVISACDDDEDDDDVSSRECATNSLGLLMRSLMKTGDVSQIFMVFLSLVPTDACDIDEVKSCYQILIEIYAEKAKYPFLNNFIPMIVEKIKNGYEDQQIASAISPIISQNPELCQLIGVEPQQEYNE